MTKRSSRSNNSQKQSETSKRKSDNDNLTRKAQKMSKDEDAGSQSRKTADVFEILLSDEMFELAYPLIDSGYGEKDWSKEDRRKPLPREKAGQMQSKSNNIQFEEKEKDKSTGKQRGYSTKNLSPFEVLLCSILMSKPLSHRLGLRTIATLFSPPFGLTTPSALEKAGLEGRREALYEARTQHKDKTAAQLGDAVEGLRRVCGAFEDKFGKKRGDGKGKEGEEDLIALKVVYESCEEAAKMEKDAKKAQTKAIEKVKDILCSNIKGLGPTGVSIFLRKIQSYPDWQVIFPYMDERANEVAIELGLTSHDKSDCLS